MAALYPAKPADCPFCHPDIREAAFLESSDFLVVCNIAPVLPGHSLVIPRQHIISLLEMDARLLTGFIETGRQALKVLLKAFNTDAFDWSIQEKPEAGQTIEHLHLHLLPRLKNDLPRPGDWYPGVHANDSMIMDSEHRSRLPADELGNMVEWLRTIASEPDLRE
jgi:bis(5'-adenosyl)-triphosphatase